MTSRPKALRRLPVTGAVLAAAVLAGCGGAAARTERHGFDNEGGRPIPCMTHQTAQPDRGYTSAAKANTGKILLMLRYYTGNGAKAYCDKKPPSPTDKTWARLYVRLGADPARVRRITGTG